MNIRGHQSGPGQLAATVCDHVGESSEETKQALLVYAHDLTAPAHKAARKWWEKSLSGQEPVGVPWVVVLAFVRLMTHATLSENPM